MSQQVNTQMIVRLKKEMDRLGYNARKLAVQASVGQSFVYDVLSGKSCNPTTNKLAAVAEVLGVSVPYLVNGTTNDNELQHITKGNVMTVTEIQPNAEGVITKEQVLYPSGKHHFFDKQWLKENVAAHYNDLRILTICHEHMHPTLKLGDTVLLDLKRQKPNPPGIFALFDGTGLVIKRIEFMPTDKASVRVSVDHSPFNAFTCPLEELDILGRVMWFSRMAD